MRISGSHRGSVIVSHPELTGFYKFISIKYRLTEYIEIESHTINKNFNIIKTINT